VVPIIWGSGAGRRQANDSRSDVVMSGVVDSGPERGHGNIDAMTRSSHSVALYEDDDNPVRDILFPYSCWLAGLE
jgi:hypothetical protein